MCCACGNNTALLNYIVVFFFLWCPSRRIRLKNSGSIEIEIESELHELFVDEEGSSSSSSNNTRSVRPHNPWVLKCHRDHLTKIKRSGGSHSQKEKEPHAQSKSSSSICPFILVCAHSCFIIATLVSLEDGQLVSFSGHSMKKSCCCIKHNIALPERDL